MSFTPDLTCKVWLQKNRWVPDRLHHTFRSNRDSTRGRNPIHSMILWFLRLSLSLDLNQVIPMNPGNTSTSPEGRDPSKQTTGSLSGNFEGPDHHRPVSGCHHPPLPRVVPDSGPCRGGDRDSSRVSVFASVRTGPLPWRSTSERRPGSVRACLLGEIQACGRTVGTSHLDP